jgi:trimethylamine--corrinoid protein Co-methyltransferase
MFGTAGCTDSCVIDEQAGVEAALSIAMTNMSGANINHDIGYSEYGTTSNLDLVVIADEVVGMARRVTAGMEINEASIGLPEIERIGPRGRFNVKAAEAELDEFDEFGDDDDDDYPLKDNRVDYKNRLVSRAAKDIWQKAGGKTLTQVANEKARDIIENHTPKPLPKDIAAKIRDLVEHAVGHMPGE